MKKEHRTLLLKALQKEMHRLYHNASLTFPVVESEKHFPGFLDWVEPAREIEAMWDDDNLQTNSDEKLWMRDVYQYGRMGRTVAPKSFYTSNGCGDGVKSAKIFADASKQTILNAIVFLRKFNQYVRDRCKALPGEYTEAWREWMQEKSAEDKDMADDCRAAFLALRKEYKALRTTTFLTPPLNTCLVLLAEMKKLAALWRRQRARIKEDAAILLRIPAEVRIFR